MSAADEVALVYAVNGTYLDTSSAACAKVVIDSSKIVFYSDCSVGTGLLTLHTANTTVRAVFTCYSALIVVRALNNHASGVFDKVNDSVGTFASAYSAADTLAGIYSRNTVLNSYSVFRTNLNAVAVSKTSERTEFITAISEIGIQTGFVTDIIVLFGRYVARAVTSDVSHLLDNVLSLKTEYISD